MPPETVIDGYTFLVAGADGRMDDKGGLYHRDTRYLSELSVELADRQLAYLGDARPSPRRRHLFYADEYSEVNELEASGEQKHTGLILERRQQVREGEGLREQLAVANRSSRPAEVELRIGTSTDFADLFEVRGAAASLDRDPGHEVGEGTERYTYSYTADGEETALATVVALDGNPEHGGDAWTYSWRLDPQERRSVRLAVGIDTALSPGSLTAEETTNTALVPTARRSLEALLTETEHGPVPLAGVPWFVTVFGRDALLTSYLTLPHWPEIAAGTLRYLAARQGTQEDGRREEEPGRIMHEERNGELADRDMTPFRRYYGSIDATPLWLMLLDEYDRQEGGLVEGLWESFRAAVRWLERRTEAGDDPFIRYDPSGDDGLDHHGWKDAEEAVQTSNGEELEPPIALAEVQGYAFAAYRGAARLEEMYGSEERAEQYRQRADQLREAFQNRFWTRELDVPVMALGGSGRTADVCSSNIGHCLWTRLIDPERAEQVVEGLFDDRLRTRWGLRNFDAEADGHSPVSYHNGSIWPHDNAVVCQGLQRYGYGDRASSLARSVLAACDRLGGAPELYCGFDAAGPVRYRSSCRPQAWSAAAVVALRDLADQK